MVFWGLGSDKIAVVLLNHRLRYGTACWAGQLGLPKAGLGAAAAAEGSAELGRPLTNVNGRWIVAPASINKWKLQMDSCSCKH